MYLVVDSNTSGCSSSSGALSSTAVKTTSSVSGSAGSSRGQLLEGDRYRQQNKTVIDIAASPSGLLLAVLYKRHVEEEEEEVVKYEVQIFLPHNGLLALQSTFDLSFPTTTSSPLPHNEHTTYELPQQPHDDHSSPKRKVLLWNNIGSKLLLLLHGLLHTIHIQYFTQKQSTQFLLYADLMYFCYQYHEDITCRRKLHVVMKLQKNIAVKGSHFCGLERNLNLPVPPKESSAQASTSATNRDSYLYIVNGHDSYVISAITGDVVHHLAHSMPKIERSILHLTKLDMETSLPLFPPPPLTSPARSSGMEGMQSELSSSEIEAHSASTMIHMMRRLHDDYYLFIYYDGSFAISRTNKMTVEAETTTDYVSTSRYHLVSSVAYPLPLDAIKYESIYGEDPQVSDEQDSPKHRKHPTLPLVYERDVIYPEHHNEHGLESRETKASYLSPLVTEHEVNEYLDVSTSFMKKIAKTKQLLTGTYREEVSRVLDAIVLPSSEEVSAGNGVHGGSQKGSSDTMASPPEQSTTSTTNTATTTTTASTSSLFPHHHHYQLHGKTITEATPSKPLSHMFADDTFETNRYESSTPTVHKVTVLMLLATKHIYDSEDHQGVSLSSTSSSENYVISYSLAKVTFALQQSTAGTATVANPVRALFSTDDNEVLPSLYHPSQLTCHMEGLEIVNLGHDVHSVPVASTSHSAMLNHYSMSLHNTPESTRHAGGDSWHVLVQFGDQITCRSLDNLREAFFAITVPQPKGNSHCQSLTTHAVLATNKLLFFHSYEHVKYTDPMPHRMRRSTTVNMYQILQSIPSVTDNHNGGTAARQRYFIDERNGVLYVNRAQSTMMKMDTSMEYCLPSSTASDAVLNAHSTSIQCVSKQQMHMIHLPKEWMQMFFRYRYYALPTLSYHHKYAMYVCSSKQRNYTIFPYLLDDLDSTEIEYIALVMGRNLSHQSSSPSSAGNPRHNPLGTAGTGSAQDNTIPEVFIYNTHTKKWRNVVLALQGSAVVSSDAKLIKDVYSVDYYTPLNRANQAPPQAIHAVQTEASTFSSIEPGGNRSWSLDEEDPETSRGIVPSGGGVITNPKAVIYRILNPTKQVLPTSTLTTASTQYSKLQVLYMSWFGTHSTILVTIRKSTSYIEVLSRQHLGSHNSAINANHHSHSVSKLHYLLPLPPGFVPIYFDVVNIIGSQHTRVTSAGHTHQYTSSIVVVSDGKYYLCYQITAKHLVTQPNLLYTSRESSAHSSGIFSSILDYHIMELWSYTSMNSFHYKHVQQVQLLIQHIPQHEAQHAMLDHLKDRYASILPFPIYYTTFVLTVLGQGGRDMSSVPQSTVYKIDPVLNMFHTIAFDAHHPFVTACYPQQSVLSVSVLNKHMLHLGNDCNDMLLLHHRSPALLHPHQCVLRRQQRLLRRLQKFKLIQRFGKEGIQAPTVSGAQQPAAYQLLLQFVVNADNDVKDRHGATEYIPLRIDLPFQTSLTTDVEAGTQVHYSLRLQRGLLCMTTSQHCYWQSMYYLLFVSIAESIASVRQHVHFTHGSNWLSKSKQISFLKKMMANVCPGILRPFQVTDTEIPWQHVSNAHSGSSLRLTLLSLETLFLFMIQQRYYQASHPHYQVFVKYLSLLAHCHPPSTTNKDTNGKDWPCQSLLFYEIISRICRKIEYQICHDLFPLQIEASTFTEETEETQEEEGKAKGRFQKMTLLTFFEYCMSQQLYLYANRILTLLCEQLGGSESQLALETCLTLCSEALYASLSSLSLRRSMECMDFVIRLEHVAKLTASASIHSTSATSPGSVQTALGSRKVVLEHIAKHRQHVVALVDDSSTTATSTNGQSKVAGFSWWNLLHVFSNKDNLKTEEEKKRQQEKEDEIKANEDVVTIAYHYTILDRVEQLKRQLNATSSQEESMLSNHSMVGFIISLVIGDWFLEPTRRPTSVSMDMRHLADAAWQTPPSRQYSLQTNHKSHCYITGIYTILLLLSNQVAYQYLRHHIEQMLTDAFLDRILSQVRLVAVEDNNGLPSPSNPIRRGSHSGGNTLGSNHGSGHGSGHGSTHSTTANHYPYQEAHLNESCEDHIRPILLLFKLHKLFMRIHNLPSIHHPVLHDVFHHVTTHSLAQMLQEFVSEHYLRRLMELELHTYASTSSFTTSAAQASDVSPASETQLPPPASTTTTTTTPASDVKLYYDLPGSVEDFEDIYLQAHHPKESVSIGGGGDVVEEDDMFLNYQYRYHTLVDYLRHDLLINADSKMPAPAGSTSPLSVLSYNLICTKESHHTRHYSLFHVLHSTMIAYLLSGDFLPCYYLLYQLRTCLPTHVYDCLQVIHSEHNDISMRRDALKWIVMNYLMVNKRFRGL